MFCIVTGMVGACSRVAATRLGGTTTQSHDTAKKGHDKASPSAGARSSVRGHAAWLAGESR